MQPDCVLGSVSNVGAYQRMARPVYEEASRTGPLEPWDWVYTSCDVWCLNAQHMLVRSPRVIAYPPGVCVYCGFPAGTKDHLLPRTVTGEARRQFVAVVPACGECNSLIGSFSQPNISERREWAHAALRRKKRATLNTKDFCEQELAEFGPGLREYVKNGMRDKQVLIARLAWPDDPFYDIAAWQRSGITDPIALGLVDNPFDLERGFGQKT